MLATKKKMEARLESILAEKEVDLVQNVPVLGRKKMDTASCMRMDKLAAKKGLGYLDVMDERELRRGVKKLCLLIGATCLEGVEAEIVSLKIGEGKDRKALSALKQLAGAKMEGKEGDKYRDALLHCESAEAVMNVIGAYHRRVRMTVRARRDRDREGKGNEASKV
mmetsp:Transcript_27236/g.70140  ORF Transcript_27236/g.70140 Transcript_27236/m.70140 type:complete len:166 (-) Transcript_27236:249-746(-)